MLPLSKNKPDTVQTELGASRTAHPEGAGLARLHDNMQKRTDTRLFLYPDDLPTCGGGLGRVVEVNSDV